MTRMMRNWKWLLLPPLEQLLTKVGQLEEEEEEVVRY